MRTGTGQRASAAAVTTVAALVLFVLGVFPLANRFTGGHAAQWYRHALILWVVVGGGLVLLLLGLARALPGLVSGAWDTASAAVLRIPKPVFLGGVALVAFVISATLTVVCFGRQPHNADEVAQLFHAKILLSGRLSLPADPNPEFFGMDNMIDRGRWYSQFPVGGPAVLALGVALGVAWLVNPLLLALTVFPLYGFARRVHGEATARAAVLLLALCPFALFMSASFMNHVPVLFLATTALMQLAVWMDAEDSRTANRAAALIGLALGGAFAIRPLDAMSVAGVIGVMQLTRLRSSAVHVRSLGVQVVAGLLPVALLFIVNARTNGAPMLLGYDVLYGAAHQLGFHPDPYGTVHTPLRALMFASKYLLQLNVLLFEWPVPAVGVIIAGLVALRRPTRWDVFLVAMLFVQVVVYALYWHDGSFRGPRFLFTALPAIVLLTVRAPFTIASITRGAPHLAAKLALPVFVLFAWLAIGINDSMPGRIRMYRRASPVGRVDPAEVARAAGLRNALVFVNEGREARNLHYLWALGMSRGNAARIMVSASSCAVRIAIDTEEAQTPERMTGRLDRIVLAAMAFDAKPPSPLPRVCIEDEARDDAGSASFAPFFPANTIGDDGRIGGDVVYVLDLGAHNEVLRERFGDRTWYRFGPLATKADSVPRIMPY